MAKKKSKKKDNDLQVSEKFLKRFEKIMEDAHDSVYALDKSGKFLFVNKKALEKLGFEDRTEILGVDFREIVIPEDLEKVVNNFVLRLKGEFILPYDISIINKQGEHVNIEITGTPIIEDGNIVGEWGVARDLTLRKKVETEIKKRSHLLEQEIEARDQQAQVYKRNIEIFMKNSNDAIIITDPDKNIASWNRGAETIYGYRADEVIGKHVTLIVPPELKIEFEGVLNEVERRGYIRNFETERLRKDGKRIIIQSTINVIRNDDGVLLGFAGIIRDITENKKMQQELIKSKLELEQAYEKLKQHNIILEDSVRMLEDTLKIKPVKELGALEEEDSTLKLDPRRCYLIKDNDPQVALNIFKKMVITQGMHGLLVTRTLPSRIRENLKLQKTPIVWLTTNRISQETCVSPSGIAELSGVIVSFLNQTKNGVILIEGLEYLISQNNFRSILNLIQLVNDKIMMSDSRLVLTLDPRTLDEKEVHLIKKEASEFLEIGAESETSKRYTHLLDRFKYEPDAASQARRIKDTDQEEE